MQKSWLLKTEFVIIAWLLVENCIWKSSPDKSKNADIKKKKRVDKILYACSWVCIGMIGAGGASCVERLRQEGFTGRVIMITEEHHLPYDRPKLSKAMHLTPDNISLRTTQFYEVRGKIIAAQYYDTYLCNYVSSNLKRQSFYK